MTIDRPSGQDTKTAQLAAEIALDQSTLVVGLRRSTARICKYAGLLPGFRSKWAHEALTRENVSSW
jgi:hypothetical protein